MTVDYEELWVSLVKRAADKAGLPFEEVQRRLRNGEAELQIDFKILADWSKVKKDNA